MDTRYFNDKDLVIVIYRTINCKFCEANLEEYARFENVNLDLAILLIIVEVELDGNLDACPV